AELSALNRAGAADVSADLLAGLGAARDAWTASSGRFDPTVGPLILAWKRGAEIGREPDADELAALRATIGFDRVTIDPQSRRVGLPSGGAIDLGGIAKGLIVDACAESIAARLRPGERALIGYGESSQRLVAGTGGDQAPALIALRHPGRPEELHQSLELHSGQGFGYASASGRVFRIGERTYSHLIDPLTGAPGALDRAAAVIAPTAAIADGLDTALCLLDPDEALALCTRLGVEALLWDGMRFRQTAGWPGRP
ncbi:MAG: FAD:protein FMN transferase, partial [Planctomycetes bacterium]|nr:FAD:protein FMN transferase [Planctomycetota bacterium]